MLKSVNAAEKTGSRTDLIKQSEGAANPGRLLRSDACS